MALADRAAALPVAHSVMRSEQMFGTPEPLAGAHVEGDAAPAPVVDVDTHRHERLDARVLRDVRLVAIRRRLLALHVALRVLAAHHVLLHLRAFHGAQRAEDLHLLVAHGVGRERDRRLHRGEAEELHEMVLDDVAGDAGLLEELPSALDADLFRHRDLHVVDVLAVPQRLEEAVGEAEDEEVLDRLLAQVVIDPEYLRLVEGLGDGVVQLLRAREVVPERLLDDDARPRRARAVLAGRRNEPRLLQVLHDDAEVGGRHREIEEPIAGGTALLVEPLEVLAELAVGRGVLEGAGDVAETALEVGPERRIDGLAARVLADALLHLGAELLVALRAPRHADHREAARQRAAHGEVVECRHQLAPREIAGGAEDDDGARLSGPVLDEAAAQGIRCLHAAQAFFTA